MRYPARLGHLITRPVFVTKLTSMAALAHDADEDEAASRLTRGLKGSLHEELLAACWAAWKRAAASATDDELLERVALGLTKRGGRAGKTVPVTIGWNTFLVVVDARGGGELGIGARVLESDEGKKRVAAALAEVASYLIGELTVA